MTTISCLEVSINDLTNIAAYLWELIQNLGGDVVLQVGAGTALSSSTVLVVESLLLLLLVSSTVAQHVRNETVVPCRSHAVVTMIRFRTGLHIGFH